MINVQMETMKMVTDLERAIAAEFANEMKPADLAADSAHANNSTLHEESMAEPMSRQSSVVGVDDSGNSKGTLISTMKPLGQPKKLKRERSLSRTFNMTLHRRRSTDPVSEQQRNYQNARIAKIEAEGMMTNDMNYHAFSIIIA